MTTNTFASISIKKHCSDYINEDQNIRNYSMLPGKNRNESLIRKTNNFTRLLLISLLLFSCDTPETVVTNYVHEDGSVTRQIIMKSGSKLEDPFRNQVPFDSTWNMSESFEVTEGDTIFTFTAEKHFESVYGINQFYSADSGSNKHLKRSVEFSKSFRWFNTVYFFAEKIDRVTGIQFPASDFFSEEDLRFFYLPPMMVDSLLNSSDSLIYQAKKAKNDSLSELYILNALKEEWKYLYIQKKPEDSAIIGNKMNDLIGGALTNELNDSLFIVTLGKEYFSENKNLLESTVNEVDSLFGSAFMSKFYTCEIVMPHKTIATSGLVDKTGKISWPVSPEYYLAQDYLMWAESRKVNYWAWLLTASFGLFVITGLFLRSFRRKL